MSSREFHGIGPIDIIIDDEKFALLAKAFSEFGASVSEAAGSLRHFDPPTVEPKKPKSYGKRRRLQHDIAARQKPSPRKAKRAGLKKAEPEVPESWGDW